VALAGAPMAHAANNSRPRTAFPRGLLRGVLGLPHLAGGNVPPLLSQTGAFSDTRNLIPAGGLIPYDIVVPFWSDGAAKSRWVAVPEREDQVFAPPEIGLFRGARYSSRPLNWPTDAANPSVKRRLETRLLVCDSAGGVYGVVYKWRPDNSDADLLGTSQTEEIPTKTAMENCVGRHGITRAGGTVWLATTRTPAAYSA